MAHKKGQGSTRNGRDSQSKRLGVKKHGGEAIRAGNIIVRQRGREVHPHENVDRGRDKDPQETEEIRNPSDLVLKSMVVKPFVPATSLSGKEAQNFTRVKM